MKKSNVWVVVGILAVAGLGVYYYNKLKKRNKDIVPIEPIEPVDVVPSPIGGGIGSGIASAVAFITNFKDYSVETKTTGLNVRNKPDAKGKLVASLPKGSTIKAKASGVRGWMEVSKDGKTTLGYVSSAFLKPKVG